MADVSRRCFLAGFGSLVAAPRVDPVTVIWKGRSCGPTYVHFSVVTRVIFDEIALRPVGPCWVTL